MHRMRRSMLVKPRSRLMAFFTTVLLVSLNSASAGGKDPLSPSPVRPGNLDHRIKLPQGYLKVYSVSDEFNVIWTSRSRRHIDGGSRPVIA